MSEQTNPSAALDRKCKPERVRFPLGTQVTKYTHKQLHFLHQVGCGKLYEIVEKAIDASYKATLQTLTPEERKDAPVR